MRGLGMTTAADAVEKARANGTRPEHVQALIAHYEARPGAWGIGALKWRVSHAAPELAVTDGWPTPAARAKRGPDDETIRERKRFTIRRDLLREGKSQEEIEAAWVAAGCM